MNLQVVGTFNFNDFNDFKNAMNYKSKKSLNFMKCIVNEAKLQSIRITLHLNSNTNYSTMDNKTCTYLQKFQSLSLTEVNDEMKNILKSKLIDEPEELEVNYMAEQKKHVIRGNS